MYLLCSILVLSYFGTIADGAPRIIGGQDAPDHKYPFQASLRTISFHLCSGSILNERWILTAGHCLEGRKTEDLTIWVGTNYLDAGGDVYTPELFIMHEEYKSFFYYDIALVRIKGKITFNEFIKPIRIPEVDLSDCSRPAWFAGWGVTETGGKAPNNLQEIELKLSTIDDCKRNTYHGVDYTHVCTYNKANEGICFGDSGGPLVVDDVVVGIASFIIPCAVGRPDVFTRVFAYKDWIETTIERFTSVSE